jgi:hypothetical protein
MTFTHTLTQSYATNAGTVSSSSLSFTGDSEADLDVAVPANSTNQAYGVQLTKSAIQALLLSCDQAVTIHTNQSAQIAAPAAPTLTPSASGGALATGTVYVKATLVNAQGETTGSSEASAAITGPAGSLLITAPSSSGDATGWKPYAATAAGAEEAQLGGAVIPFGTNVTLTSIATGGAAPPAANTTGTQDTIPLTAGVPVIWYAAAGATSPFAGNVTTVFVTNTNAVAANLKIRALQNF